MSAFRYRAATGTGEVRVGEIMASSAAEARRQLQRQGLYPVEVGGAGRAEGLRRSFAGAAARFRANPALTLRFTRELSDLLEAGFSLDRSLALLAGILRGRRGGGELIPQVRERLRQGAPFSEALADHPSLFSPLYLSMVRAGEEAGALPTIIGRLAAYLERRAELRDRFVSAMIYPAIMAFVGGAAVLVLLLVVIPKFAAILEGADQGLPASTALVLGVSTFMIGYWWLILLGTALAALGLGAYAARPAGRRRLDRLVLALPLIGRLRSRSLAAQFCRTLATLLASGVSFLAAVRTAAATISSPIFGELFVRVEERVQKGQPMADALAASAVFPDVAAQMIEVGEASGELERMLGKAADMNERAIERDIQRLLALLEPALILMFGVAVAVVALAMLQAIYSINAIPL